MVKPRTLVKSFQLKFLPMHEEESVIKETLFLYPLICDTLDYSLRTCFFFPGKVTEEETTTERGSRQEKSLG